MHILAYLYIFFCIFLACFSIFVACLMHIHTYHCMVSIFLHIAWMFLAYFLHISCIFLAYFLHISCIFLAYFLHISCILTHNCISLSYFLHISCIFLAYCLHIPCIFTCQPHKFSHEASLPALYPLTWWVRSNIISSVDHRSAVERFALLPALYSVFCLCKT
jgi:hypothetical protein